MKKIILIIALALKISAYAQEDKTVTLVVGGQGKTQEEARKNALRSAIEQAFGTFISSKTEIINDKLVKDEIILVSNGNIQNYSIISEVKLSEKIYGTTLKTTVSVTKLVSYCQSKGYEVQFNGNLFAMNINLQKLNEESEYKAIKNICDIGEKLLRNSLDYTIELSEPISVNGSSDLFELKYSINAKYNKSFILFLDMFINTLNNLKMSTMEIDNYKKINKNHFWVWEYTDGSKGMPFDLYTIINELNMFDKFNKYMKPDSLSKYYLRSPKSLLTIQDFVKSSENFFFNVSVSSNIDLINLNNLKTNEGLQWLLTMDSDSSIRLNMSFSQIGSVINYSFKRKYTLDNLSKMENIKLTIN